MRTKISVPVNEDISSESLVSFVRHPMLVGIVPCKYVYSIYKDCRLLSRPMVVGRAPLRLTNDIYRLDKLDIEPIAVGIDPRAYIPKLVL
jgi:hypothetical protein